VSQVSDQATWRPAIDLMAEAMSVGGDSVVGATACDDARGRAKR